MKIKDRIECKSKAPSITFGPDNKVIVAVCAKQWVAQSFIERFHLHLIVSGIMLYSIAMVFVMRVIH